MSTTPARLFVLLLVLAASACSSLTPHQRAYAVGAISKAIIEEADRELWDPFVQERTAACDPSTHPEVKTKQDFNACLGVAVHDAEVLQGLETYGTVAGALFVLLKSTDSDPEMIKTAKQKVLDAALAVLNEMGPQAKHYVDNLKALTRGK